MFHKFLMLKANFLALIDMIDKVLLFEDRLDNVYLAHVLIDICCIGSALWLLNFDLLPWDEVPLINDTLLIMPNVVIKENLKSVIITLVYNQWLSVNSFLAMFLPGFEIVF